MWLSDESVPYLPAVRAFLERYRDGAGSLNGVQLAFDVTGDPAFPERPAFEVARELGLAVTTHAGVWGATGDDSVLNGIAWDARKKRLFVTGKYWPKLYEIALADCR